MLYIYMCVCVCVGGSFKMFTEYLDFAKLQHSTIIEATPPPPPQKKNTF